MIAVEVKRGGAASIVMVLAALSFVHEPAAISTPPAPQITTKIELGPSYANVVVEDMPPPPIDGAWQGTCNAGELGWPDMPIMLSLHGGAGGKLHATATLAFVDRTTRAALRGAMWNDRARLTGHMTEIGGLGTTWRISLRLHAVDDQRLRGTFVELHPDGGSARMCTFDWRR